jgi:septal ring factor EnvC (AmiA/AmiB activator)
MFAIIAQSYCSSMWRELKLETVTEQLRQIHKDIELHEAKIKDNCNIQHQLQKENTALRNTIALLKHKRHELIFSDQP